MTLFVRKVDMKRWVPSSPANLDDADDIEADPVCDFKTTRNSLSIYEVADENDAKRAVAAVAAGSRNTQNVGYSMFSLEELEAIGIEPEKADGKTADKDVNEWHRDIVKLSGKALIRLAVLIKSHTPRSMLPGVLAETYAASIREEYIKLEDINNSTIQKKTKEILDGLSD